MEAWKETSWWSTGLFTGLVLLLCAGFVWGSGRAARGAGWGLGRGLAASAVGVGLWLGVFAWIAESGFLEVESVPPRVMLVFALTNIAVVGLSFSRVGGAWAREVPMWVLVGAQGFRLPLELILHQWYQEGSLPVQMTFRGDNFDIVTGILGVAVLGWKFWRGEVPRWALWCVSVVGVGLLARVAFIAVSSVPAPWRSYTEGPPLLLAYSAPHIWIVSVCVGGALFLHVVALRGLWSGRQGS
jgi:hypothetical protein